MGEPYKEGSFPQKGRGGSSEEALRQRIKPKEIDANKGLQNGIADTASTKGAATGGPLKEINNRGSRLFIAP